MNKLLLGFLVLLLSCAVTGKAESPKNSPEKKPTVIGLSVLTTNNPFFVEMAGAMKTEATRRGADVLLTSAELDATKQKDQVSDFIKQGVNAIVLCPADSRAIGVSIAEAYAAGIPIFTADIAAIAEADKVVCHVATDNLGGGREAGRAMIEALGGKGKVAILDHPEVQSVMLRTKGFKEVIDEYNRSGKGKIEIVATLPCRGGNWLSFALATQLLKDQPDLNGIFAINDPSALGVVLALEKSGKLDQVKVIGFDAMPAGKQAIKQGKIWGDPVQFPDKIGQQTIEAVFKHLHGEKIPKEILIPTTFYSRADEDKDSIVR